MTAKRGPLGEKGGRNEGLTNVSAAETGKKIREGLKKNVQDMVTTWKWDKRRKRTFLALET